MNEVKIQIPDNCELIKDGDTYIVREKKQEPPRSWEEFCKRYPKKIGEAFSSSTSDIYVYPTSSIRNEKNDKNVCSSKEEAFLALMQLRQLRKAWIGNWEPIKGEAYWSIINNRAAGIHVNPFSISSASMSFPTNKMAEDFLSCFRDLCETAKSLL